MASSVLIAGRCQMEHDIERQVAGTSRPTPAPSDDTAFNAAPPCPGPFVALYGLYSKLRPAHRLSRASGLENTLPAKRLDAKQSVLRPDRGNTASRTEAASRRGRAGVDLHVLKILRASARSAPGCHDRPQSRRNGGQIGSGTAIERPAHAPHLLRHLEVADAHFAQVAVHILAKPVMTPCRRSAAGSWAKRS